MLVYILTIQTFHQKKTKFTATTQIIFGSLQCQQWADDKEPYNMSLEIIDTILLLSSQNLNTNLEDFHFTN